MSADALLVIDLPDERSGTRRQFDHLHARGTKAEMEVLKRLLEDQFGSGRQHQVIDGYVCPYCGVDYYERGR